MKKLAPLLWVLAGIVSCCSTHNPHQLQVQGLQEPVEVLRDSAGVNHIYAKNEHDLFFAQGYCAARDRLFQFEVWRRQATGTVAEILGPGEFKRDVGARLFAFRGDLEAELNHYHPRGKEIITAFTDGINAYVHQVLKDTSLLPLEFRLLGILPGTWEPRDVISRHQGLLGNLPDELRYARAIATVGEAKVREVVNFEPGDPDLRIDPSIDQKALFDSILSVYDAFRATLRFKPEHLRVAHRNSKDFERLAEADEARIEEMMATEKESIGSNNWIVSGKRSASGKPMLANDPHRAIAVPSLRYMVHLNAPGWNVVGGGEPTIPGVSIGHNEHGAWGLTIFNIDGEDLYVYKLNPENKDQYLYKGTWQAMTIVYDTIPVENEQPRPVQHRYTQHGPVMYVDTVRLLAYAARCAWLDIGAAPYLASLRIDQATTWEEFREGCSFSRIPGENMIWADKQGNIGWQAVGVAPVRTNYSGLVPVPGDGRYEWDSYLPIPELPHLLNPEAGYFATANENNVPADYPHRNAVGWNWADPFRVNRINEVLSSRGKHTQEDMMQLQVDYLSLPARSLVPLLADLSSAEPLVEAFRRRLLAWNFLVEKNSVEAAVYVGWEKKLNSNLRERVVPQEGQKYLRSIPLRRVIAWLSTPTGPLKSSTEKKKLLLTSLEQTIADLKATLGNDTSAWVYGQEKLHHVRIKHPMSNAVDEATRAKLEVGPLPRGGYGATPGVTSNSNNQSTGASFRIVADLSDWDKTMFTNAPGQSGDPASPYYRNLFRSWAEDRHFPVYFTRDRVNASVRERLTLAP
ncbi:MAG: penicillin acylase family protein [Cyclobacteriaceae bacterium]|nr:penicillin acylase family protein [Cyclobacteriaceae bacterium]